MSDLSSAMTTLFDFLQVVIGFSLIIIIHELGHFLAARWAGVRVLAFAVGFGPAVLSYRKGLGFRRGSSEQTESAKPLPPGASATEYRLNWLPLGGYVKMLGQDDADPTATSEEPDSYQNCPVWKRMVVISAGVVFNLLTAAVLFIIVFMAGLRTPPPTIGMVDPDSPAGVAVATNADAAGLTEAGLSPGDTVVRVNGRKAEEFTDVIVGAAMSAPHKPVRMEVSRPGVDPLLHFDITPRRDEATGLLDLGIGAAWSARLVGPDVPEDVRAQIEHALADAELHGVEPGMTLRSVDGREVTSALDLTHAVEASGGRPIQLIFGDENGTPIEATLTPLPQIQTARLAGGDSVWHLLGLPTPVRVSGVNEAAEKAGLQRGDIFSRLGATEWPVAAVAVPEIQRHAGEKIDAEVIRMGENGWMAVPLELPVNEQGRIGFEVSPSASRAAFIAGWPDSPFADGQDAWRRLRPAEALGDLRGRRILAVNGEPVTSLLQVREVLKDLTREALASEEALAAGVTVTLRMERPAYPAPVEVEIPWTLGRASIELLHDTSRLGWVSPLRIDAFSPAEITLKADGPAAAVAMGLRRTQRVMSMTYLTFVRLFQGSVKVEHLKGPVGIAHVGTVVADRGFVWLLFFMALISVNLAVINFLPIPIADGGHFVFLLYEQITGKPPPLAVQNAAAIAGLVLIASVFLVVTFNDIRNLF